MDPSPHVRFRKSIEFSTALQQPFLEKENSEFPKNVLDLDNFNNLTNISERQCFIKKGSLSQSKILKKDFSYLSEQSIFLDDELEDFEQGRDDQRHYGKFYRRLLKYQRMALSTLSEIVSRKESILTTSNLFGKASAIKPLNEPGSEETELKMQKILLNRNIMNELKSTASSWAKNINLTTKKYLNNPQFVLRPNPISRALVVSPKERVLLASRNKLISCNIDSESFCENFDKDIESVAFCKKRSLLVSSSNDGILKILELKDSFTLLDTINTNSGAVNLLEISLDGELLLSASKDKQINLFSLEDLKLIHFWKTTDDIYSLTVSPDNKFVLSGFKTEGFELYSIQGPIPIRVFTSNPLGGAIKSVGFSPSSDLFFVAGALDFHVNTPKCGFKVYITSNFTELYSKHIDSDETDVIKAEFLTEDKIILCNSNSIYEYDNIKSSLKVLNILEDQITSVSLSYTQDEGMYFALVIKNSTLEILSGYNKITKEALIPDIFQIKCIQVSKDELLLASGGVDCYLRVYSLSEGVLLHEVKNHTKTINSVAFSFSGKKLMSGGEDYKIYIYFLDKETLQPDIEIDLESFPVSSVVFSPIDYRILIGTKRKNVYLYDIDYSTREYKRIYSYENHLDNVNVVIFSPDGTQFLSGSSDKLIVKHKIKLGVNSTLTRKKIALHKDAVRALAFSQEGDYILSGGYDCCIMLIKTENDEKVYDWTLPDDYENVLTVGFNPTTTNGIAGFANFSVIVFDLFTREIKREINLHNGKVRGTMFSFDGKKIITAGEDGTILVLDNWQREIETKYIHHSDTIRAVVISPDGKKFASGGDDLLLNIYELESRMLIHSIPHDKWISCIEFSPDSLEIITGSGDKLLRLFSSESGILIRVFSGHHEWISSVKFSPSGLFIVSGSVDKTFRTYDRFTGFQLKCFPKETKKVSLDEVEEETFNLAIVPYLSSQMIDTNKERTLGIKFENEEVTSIVFTADEEFVIVGFENGKIKIIAFRTGNELESFHYHKKAVNSMAYLKTRAIIVSGSDDSSVVFFDRNERKILETIENDNEINIVCASDNEMLVAFGGKNAEALVVNLNGFQRRKITFKGYSDSETVFSATFLPESQRILFALGSKLVIVEDQDQSSNTCDNIFLFEKVDSIAFSQDAKFIAVTNRNPDADKNSDSEDDRATDTNILSDPADILNSNYDAAKKAVVTNQLKILDGINGRLICSYVCEGKSTKSIVKFSKQGNFLAVGHRKLDVYDTKMYRLLLSDDQFKTEITAVEIAGGENTVYVGVKTGNVYRITFDSNDPPTIAKTLLGKFHSCRIVDIYYVEKEGHSLLLTVGEDLNINLFNINKKRLKYEIRPHKETINCLAVCLSEDFFLTGSDDGTAKLFELYTGSEIRLFLNCSSRIIGVGFTCDDYYVVVCEENSKIRIYHKNSGFQVKVLETGKKNYCLAVSPNRDTLVVGIENGLKIIEQLFNNSQELGMKMKIFDKATSSIEGFQMTPKDLGILPFPLKMNKLILYILLCSNVDILLEKVENLHLKKLINQKLDCMDYCYLTRDEFNLSAIDYFLSICQYQEESLEKISRMFLYRNFPNVWLVRNKAKIIEKIALEYSSELPGIFKAFTRDIESLNLPYDVEKEELIILESKSCYPSSNAVQLDLPSRKKIKSGDSEKDTQEADEDSLKSNIIIRKRLILYKINFSFVTPRDIGELLNLFSSYPLHHPLYRSESFINLIMHLWKKKGQKDFLCDALFYFIFLLFISFNCLVLFPLRSVSNKRNSLPEVFSIALDVSIILVLIFFYSVNEFREIKNSYGGSTMEKIKLHFKSFWNILDITVIIFGFSFSLLDIICILKRQNDEGLEDSLKFVCATFFLLAWIRVLDQARGFTMSSPLIRVISRVIHDMMGFFTGLFFLLIGLSSASFLLQSDYQQHSLTGFFKIFYYMLIGDFAQFNELETVVNSEILFAILFLSTITTVFIMLTLLIAIISDSFNKVMSLEKQADAFEKLQLMYQRGSRRSAQENASYLEKIYIYALKRERNQNLNDPLDKIQYRIEKLEKTQKKIREFQLRDNRILECNAICLDQIRQTQEANNVILLEKINKLAIQVKDSMNSKLDLQFLKTQKSEDL